MQKHQDAIDTQSFAAMLYSLFKQVDDSFLASMVKNNDIELLMRKLPPQLV